MLYTKEQFECFKTLGKKKRQSIQKFSKNSICAEVGVFEGGFSKVIQIMTEPKKLYLIDCWQKFDDNTGWNRDPMSKMSQQEWDDVYQNVLDANKDKENVEVIKFFSISASAMFEDEYFDWVYIDANHSYQAVLDDLNAWYPKVKKGGILCGDDYYLYKWVDVHTAVSDFLKQRKLKLNYVIGNDWGIKRV